MTDKTFEIYLTWCKALRLVPSRYNTLKAFIAYYFRGFKKKFDKILDKHDLI